MLDLGFESTRTLDQEEFWEWVMARPRNDPNDYELLNGRVVMNPPAGFPHGEVEGAIVELLRRFVMPRGLGRVFGSSQGFDLPHGETVGPDASVVSAERWRAAPRPEEGKFLRVVPDLVVEILSPGSPSASRDRGEKKAIYEANGVSEYWIVHPSARQVTVFVARDGRFDAGTVVAEDGTVRSVVLAGLEFRVADVMPAGD